MIATQPTHAQVARQRRRERSGQYLANPCSLCGRGAPIDDYQSHVLTDRDDPLGEHVADYALVLCDGCGNATNSLRYRIQLEVFASAVSRSIRRDRAETLAIAFPLPVEGEEAEAEGDAAVVLEEGTPYRMQSRPADSTIRFPRTAPRECFVNVVHLVYVVPGLEYVEGYGAIAGVPFLHAWAEGRHGEVYDPTIDWSDPRGRLDDDGEVSGTLNPLMLGVRIPRALVTAKVNADGWLPFIDDYRHDWPLLRDRWRPRDVAFIKALARTYRRQAEEDGPR